MIYDLLVRRLGTTVVLSAAALLGACGGSGGGEVTNAPTVSGTVAGGVIAVPANEAGHLTYSVSQSLPGTPAAGGASLSVSGTSAALAAATDGQVVTLPADDAQGLPFGYTGIARRQSDGSIKLEPAMLGDMFKSLKVDFDSERDGGQIVGVIAPKSGTITLTQVPPATQQAGVVFKPCQQGISVTGELKCEKGLLSGTLSIEHPIRVKQRGGPATTIAKVYATFELSKLKVRADVDFDLEKYPSTEGVNKLGFSVKGEYAFSGGIRLDDETFEADIPSFRELLDSDKVNIWDTNTRVKFGKYFELSGLDGDDKNGLIPLGGFYITPAGGTPFVGDLSGPQLGAIKTLAAVIWVYIDFEGNITLSGDAKLLEKSGAAFERGLSIDRVNSGLKPSVVSTTSDSSLVSPKIKGSLEASLTPGVGLAADILIGGIRPVSLKSRMIAATLSGKVEGEGGYRWSPASTSGLEGSLCAEVTAEAFSDLSVAARVKAAAFADWLNVGFEWRPTPLRKSWGRASTSRCSTNATLGLTATVDTATGIVNVDFRQAAQDASLRNLTDKWRLFVEDATASRFVDIPTTYAGAYPLALEPGAYTLKLVALASRLLNFAARS